MSFTSCGDEDEDLDNLVLTQANIVGNWASDTEDYQEIYSIDSHGVIGYMYDNLEDDKNWMYIDAGGTYTVDGNVITAKYNQVEVGGYSGYSTKSVMGFTNNTPKTIKYTIVDYTDDSMTIKNETTGKTTKYFKY